jgi:hypothetical protein
MPALRACCHETAARDGSSSLLPEASVALNLRRGQLFFAVKALQKWDFSHNAENLGGGTRW